MSQANQLADLILDEIIEETVDEMQRLETNPICNRSLELCCFSEDWLILETSAV